MKIGKVIFAVCAAAVGVAALSLSACRSCSSRTLEGAAEVQAAPFAGEVPVAAGGERNDMRKDKENIMTYAVISTEKGDMKAELYTKETPGTAQNFIKLAESGFYDGLTFHSVIPGFVIQGGCPVGDGTGGPGYTIKCETDAPRQYHDRGVLSMAHRGKDTGGSQFFICYNRENTKHLDGVHTCFGKVVEGLDVIDAIRPGDRIRSIRIVEE